MVVLVNCKNEEIQSKMVELECSQDFPHYNPMVIICCYGNQSSDRIMDRNFMQPCPHPNDAPDEILVGFVALRPKSTAMVIAGRSVHLTTLFPGQA